MLQALIIILVFFTASCDQKPSGKLRHYTEITIESPLAQAPMMGGVDPHAGLDMGAVGQDPHAGLDMSAFKGMDVPKAGGGAKSNLAWDVPKGWVEKPGSAMRLVTLRLVDDTQAIDCSIVSIPGEAGGLEPNLKRWMGQIGLDVPEEQFVKFITGSKDKVFDLSILQKGSDASQKSMIAAILTIDRNTVFVKMTGTIAVISKHKNEFLGLVKSVHSK